MGKLRLLGPDLDVFSALRGHRRKTAGAKSVDTKSVDTKSVDTKSVDPGSVEADRKLVDAESVGPRSVNHNPVHPTFVETDRKSVEDLHEPGETNRKPVETNRLQNMGQVGESLEERMALLRDRFLDFEALREQFDAISSPVFDVLGMHAESQARLAETTTLLNQSHADIEGLQSELTVLRQQGEAAALKTRELTEALQARDEQVKLQEEALANSASDIAELRTAAERQSRKLLAEEERANELAQINQTVTQDVARLEEQVSVDKKKFEELSDSAAFDGVEIKRLRDQVETLQTAQRAAQRRSHELEMEQQKLRQTLAATELKAAMEHDGRMAGEEMREQDKVAFGNEVAFLTAQNEALSERLAATNKTLDQTRAGLADKVDKLRVADRAAREAAVDKLALERSALTVDEELQRLTTQKNEVDARAQEAEERCAMLTKTLSARDSRIAQMTTEVESLTRKSDEFGAKYEHEREQRESLDRRFAEEVERERAERALAQGALTIARASRERLLEQVEMMKRKKTLFAQSIDDAADRDVVNNVRALRGPME